MTLKGNCAITLLPLLKRHLRQRKHSHEVADYFQKQQYIHYLQGNTKHKYSKELSVVLEKILLIHLIRCYEDSNPLDYVVKVHGQFISLMG